MVDVESGGEISQVFEEIAANSRKALADTFQELRAGALKALDAQRQLMLSAAGLVAGGTEDAFIEVASAFKRAHAPGTERGDAWAVFSRGDLEAAKRLIKRWRPWPFDRRAQGVLKKMPRSAKMSFLERLPQELVDETTRLKREPRCWRDNRVWLKENGRRAKFTVRELDPTFFVKQLRNLARKLNTSAILASFDDLPLKESHGQTPSFESQLLDADFSRNAQDEVRDLDSLLTDSTDDACDAFVERDSLELSESQSGIGALLEIAKRVATPRENELIDEIRLQLSEGRLKPNGNPNMAEVGRAIGINPSTARVHWGNLKKKARKAASKAN